MDKIQQWEYRIDKIPESLSLLGALMDVAGKSGWEMVCIKRCWLLCGYVVYKRLKQNNNG